MAEHHAPHNSSRGTGTQSAPQAEAEASRIERLNVADTFARNRYTPSFSECLAILGLPPTTSLEQAQERFRALSRLFHPDTTPLTDRSRAGGLFALVRRAWDELRKNPSFTADTPPPSHDNTPPPREPFQHESYDNEHARSARERYRIRERLDRLSPEVGFLLCDYLRAKVLKTVSSLLETPRMFSGRDGNVRRTQKALEMFAVLEDLTVEVWFKHAGLMVAHLEKRLAPTLGVRDYSALATRVSLWASTLGFSVLESRVITSQGMECAQCLTEFGFISFPSIHNGFARQRLEPWVFGEHAEVYRKIQPRLSDSTSRLVGGQVPIFIEGILSDERSLESRGLRVCTAKEGIRGDYRDRFDGIEVRTSSGTCTISFDARWIRSACLSVSGGSQELLVEFHPSQGEVTPMVARYDLSRDVVGASGTSRLPGTIVLATDASTIGSPAPSLSLLRG